MISAVGQAISIFGLYWQLIHVKGKSALHIIFFIKVESRSLERYMFKRTFLILESLFTMKIELLKCSIVDIFNFDGRLWSRVVFFVM